MRKKNIYIGIIHKLVRRKHRSDVLRRLTGGICRKRRDGRYQVRPEYGAFHLDRIIVIPSDFYYNNKNGKFFNVLAKTDDTLSRAHARRRMHA